MRKVKDETKERILDMTMEIVFLLTGEDYTVLNKRGEHVTHIRSVCMSKGYCGTESFNMKSSFHSVILEGENDKKILELSKQIINLLTGEVCVRCEDVTVHFSMEEWEYLEEHSDHYKNMVGDHQSLSLLGSEEMCRTSDIDMRRQYLQNEKESALCEVADLLDTDVYVSTEHILSIKEESDLRDDRNLSQSEFYTTVKQTPIEDLVVDEEEFFSCKNENLNQDLYRLQSVSSSNPNSESCTHGPLTDHGFYAPTDYIQIFSNSTANEKTLSSKTIDSYDVTVSEDIGDIQLLKIEKYKYWYKDDWYCRHVTVKTPAGEYLEFPCYRWILNDKETILREGKAKLVIDDITQIHKQHRRKELENRQKLYRWKEWHPGFPLSFDAHYHSDLPHDIQFDSEKGVDFVLNYTKAMENLFVNSFMHMFQSSWNDFADFEKIFVRISNTISEYVMQHWKEDFMFGYQFLNGCNPVLIKKCTKLPDNFPVTHEMVECSLERKLTLDEEIKEGNIFIVDFHLLDGISVNKTDPCTIQYIAAPLCLLYKNLENKVVPIAIQLNQEPGPENPIYFPSDSHYDWLLAKIWVRSSDFHIHQTVSHLLRSHLLSEVFAIAMFRQLPAVHPLFKLLIPHVRFTIAINTKAREQLICECGLFDKANATGGGGHVELVLRAMKNLTYQSLCLPEAIKMRGMESKEDIPYYFYRDDGTKVWEAILSFVGDVVDIYYEGDKNVQEDPELQAFVKDVFVYGLRDNEALGFPKTIKTKEQVVEYITLVIFTASGQHAAVNFGQYDWCSWIPNSPPTMRRPPPTNKDEVTIEYIIESLPDRGRSCWHLGAVWALSQFQDNELFLGFYPDEHFTEKPVKEAMVKFRKRLEDITNFIQERNKNKKLPYYYLSPERVPNSVAV